MNRSFTTHGSWLLVTGMLFVAGSQLARRGAPLDQLGSTSHADKLSGLANTPIHGTKSSAPLIASEDQDNAENDSANVIPSTTTGSSPQPRTGKTPAPITESQAKALPLAAPKCSTPSLGRTRPPHNRIQPWAWWDLVMGNKHWAHQYWYLVYSTFAKVNIIAPRKALQPLQLSTDAFRSHP